jgi:hypothetical protein
MVPEKAVDFTAEYALRQAQGKREKEERSEKEVL